MTKFTDKERENLLDLLQNYVDEEVVFAIAKSFTKNAMPIQRPEEAYNVIFLHGVDVRTVLNKRHVTRDILFEYLHKNEVSIQTNFTKLSLIEEILKLWDKRYRIATTATTVQETSTLSTASSSLEDTSHFPINLMARQFTAWFFERYNANEINAEDFWIDAQLKMTTYFEDAIDEQDASTSSQVVETLLRVKNDLKLFFNACAMHHGSQGRIDVHGLVLVLSCGTIHTPGYCVGIFECIFKLARDPYAENNWKIKGTNFVIKSKMDAQNFSLNDSETLQSLLCLPPPSGDI